MSTLAALGCAATGKACSPTYALFPRWWAIAVCSVSDIVTGHFLPKAAAGLTQCTGMLIPQAVCDANKGMKSVVVDVADPKSVQVLAPQWRKPSGRRLQWDRQFSVSVQLFMATELGHRIGRPAAS